ncbi:MAG TPA: hypothetical protein VHC48_02690, partial [Puia sp.]|nr:hypothetical protein [Puia sp.]
MPSLILLYVLAVLAVVGDFLYFLVKGRRNTTLSSPGWALVLFPLAVLLLILGDSMTTNDCCGGWSILSPQHSLSVYVLISLCIVAYFYCVLRSRLAPPLLEVVVNCLLLTGVVLSLVFGIQDINGFSWVILT